jgi:hypothetical protein
VLTIADRDSSHGIEVGAWHGRRELDESRPVSWRPHIKTCSGPCRSLGTDVGRCPMRGVASEMKELTHSVVADATALSSLAKAAQVHLANIVNEAIGSTVK